MSANALLGSEGAIWEADAERLQALLSDLSPPAFAITPEEVARRTGPREIIRQQSTAVLPLRGLLTQRPSLLSALFGGTSTDKFGQAFDALVRRKDIAQIVLDIDSPGGTVSGTLELAEKIYQARGTKPIIAVANSFAASAAYKIASAADRIIVTPSGQVGSIGVRAMHIDYSGADEKAGVKVSVVYAGEHKTEFDLHAAFSKEARAEMQRVVDVFYRSFVWAVARNRGTTAASVRADYGGGRMLLAADALAVGAVDGIGTLESVVGRLSGGGSILDHAAQRARAQREAELVELHGGRDKLAEARRRDKREREQAAETRRLELNKLEAEIAKQ